MTKTIIYTAVIVGFVLITGCVDMKQERPKKQQTDSSGYNPYLQ